MSEIQPNLNETFLNRNIFFGDRPQRTARINSLAIKA